MWIWKAFLHRWPQSISMFEHGNQGLFVTKCRGMEVPLSGHYNHGNYEQSCLTFTIASTAIVFLSHRTYIMLLFIQRAYNPLSRSTHMYTCVDMLVNLSLPWEYASREVTTDANTERRALVELWVCSSRSQQHTTLLGILGGPDPPQGCY